MNALMNIGGTAAALTMSSREIAELVGSRHDNVRTAVERLAEKGVITLPAMQEKPTAGRPSLEYVFSGEQGKRDSIVVVAQLSPEFTARLVDRWQELEAAAAARSSAIPRNFAEPCAWLPTSRSRSSSPSCSATRLSPPRRSSATGAKPPP